MTGPGGGRRWGWLRWPAYPVACALAVAAVGGRVVAIGPDEARLDALLESGGWLAWLQVLAISSAAALCIARARRRRSALAVLLALLLLAGVAVELNDALDVRSQQTAYRRLSQLFGLACVAYGVARRRRLAGEAPAFAGRVGFGLMLAGMLLAAGVARLLGDGDVWAVLATGGLRSSARHLVQEGVAVVGYLLVAFGALEEWLHGAGGHPGDGRAQSPGAVPPARGGAPPAPAP